MESSFGRFEILLAGLATLAIFSFLYKENPFYRLFEHLYIGIATAVTIMAFVQTFIWPQVIKPLFGLDVVVYPDGSIPQPYDPRNLLLLIPIAFGSLYYFILSRRWSWVAQLVIGFSLGIGGGVAFKGVLNEMLPKLRDSFRPLFVPGDIGTSATNIIFVVTLLTAMSYFFFTFKRRPNGLGARSAAVGRMLMMCCFGAYFGATIMARMALLVERMQFLIFEWWKAVV